MMTAACLRNVCIMLNCCVKLFSDVEDVAGLALFESGKRTVDKQEMHTVDAAKLLEHHLKRTLLGLVHKLFGKGERIVLYVCKLSNF